MPNKDFNPLEMTKKDEDQYALIQAKGGFSTELSFRDLQRLRAIVKKVHLRHYPSEHITDYEADRVIDVLAPATKEYLIRKAIAMGAE